MDCKVKEVSSKEAADKRRGTLLKIYGGDQIKVDEVIMIERLFQLACCGDVDAIRECSVQLRPKDDAWGKLGKCLHWVTERKDLSTVKACLAKGADPNYENDQEETPLFAALKRTAHSMFFPSGCPNCSTGESCLKR